MPSKPFVLSKIFKVRVSPTLAGRVDRLVAVHPTNPGDRSHWIREALREKCEREERRAAV